MVRLINFPKPHEDFTYIHESCAICTLPFSDDFAATEIIDEKERCIMYVCKDCTKELSSAKLQLIDLEIFKQLKRRK